MARRKKQTPYERHQQTIQEFNEAVQRVIDQMKDQDLWDHENDCPKAPSSKG